MATLPPLPWDWVAAGAPSANGQFNAYLVDANGRKIAAIWGKGDEKTLIADHILKLVNENGQAIVPVKVVGKNHTGKIGEYNGLVIIDDRKVR